MAYEPTATAKALKRQELIAKPTQWYKVQTTDAPSSSLLIGLGTFTLTDGGIDTCKYAVESSLLTINIPGHDILSNLISDYWECLNAPFTTISGFAGCGRDDTYTSCSGNSAFGVDGDVILW